MRTILRLAIASFIAMPVIALVIVGLWDLDWMATIVGKLIAVLVIIWAFIAPIKLLILRK